MSETGKRIRSRRKELGISANKLAEILGVNKSTIYRYEKGDIEKVPGNVIEILANALLTTPYDLMGWENNLDAEFIPQMMKDKVLVEHIKLMMKLNPQDQKSVFDMIEFLSRKN